jgi:hypothetical protein
MDYIKHLRVSTSSSPIPTTHHRRSVPLRLVIQYLVPPPNPHLFVLFLRVLTPFHPILVECRACRVAVVVAVAVVVLR